MRCPFCFHKIVVTHQARLETLVEHVSDPNGEPSLKDAYQCVNLFCKMWKSCAWDESGDFYGDPRGASRLTRFISGRHCTAIGSWSWKYSLNRDFRRAFTFKITIGRMRYEFFPVVLRVTRWERDDPQSSSAYFWRSSFSLLGNRLGSTR